VKRAEVIRSKVKAFARMNYMAKMLQNNSEKIARIKHHNPTGKLEMGTILGGQTEIEKQYMLYKQAAMHVNDGFPVNSRRFS